MADAEKGNDIDFTVDKANLYREEAITDLKVASIRRLIPVNPDGSEDLSRTSIFVGHTQLMTPEGPLPIQSELAANNFQEALDAFPEAMQSALSEVIEQAQRMAQEQPRQKDDSRIIVPGR